MAFTVNQKVVCIDDSPTDILGGKKLRLGEIYTIRWSGLWGFSHPGANRQFEEHPCVRLNEIFRGPEPAAPHVKELNDMPFNADRFRPLTDTKASVSFTQGAPKDSDVWDNRKVPAKVTA
jgi:hypothetical protein